MPITLTLSPQASEIVQSRIKSGEFATALDVIDAAPDGMSAADLEIEEWLSTIVDPTYDAIKDQTMATYSSRDGRAHLANIGSQLRAKQSAAFGLLTHRAHLMICPAI